MSQLQATRFISSCAICYDDYTDGDMLSSSAKCGHLFHKACLDKWLSHKQECPACRCTISVKSSPPISLARSTPNIFGNLDVMETLYLFNVLQALVRPLEKKPHLYIRAYDEVIACILDTFRVSKGQETAQQLYNRISATNSTNYKNTIIEISTKLYEALLRFIPQQGFTQNEIVKENYFKVCDIPSIEQFRNKYLNAS